MKKIAVLLLLVLCLPYISYAQIHFIRLRSSHNPDFMRIVLEGNEAALGKASVYQRGQTVLVSIPETTFSIRAEKIMIPFKKQDKETIVFSPGDFRGLKVFTLKNPFRLVIDVYIKEKRQSILSQILPSGEDSVSDVLSVRTVVIDPGHGGYEFGIVSDNKSEKNIVLDISRKLNQLINRGSAESHLTRGSDQSVSMDERVNFANKKNADVFISLHIGNHKNVVLYKPVVTENVSDVVRPHLMNRGQEKEIEKTMKLIRAMNEAIRADLGDDMVSTQPLPYSMLVNIQAAALIVELPSMSDIRYDEKFKNKIAGDLKKGLEMYEEINSK
jgi:N-acetylmuramoyl-L-alanine amidase